MRQWKMRCYDEGGLTDFDCLEKAKAKGYTCLSNVKIHFDATGITDLKEFERAMTMLKCWEDKIIGLDIKCLSTEVLSLDLPKLERLALIGPTGPSVESSECTAVAVEMMSHHAKKLKELTLDRFNLSDVDTFGPTAPKLDYLKLKGVYVSNVKPIFDFGKNVTKLVLDPLEMIGNRQDFNSESLKLPNLRELTISRDFEGYDLLINSNAEWLETLQLYSCDTYIYHFLPMPNLKVLVCVYIDEYTVTNILQASPSLQTLIYPYAYANENIGIHLPKLKKLIANSSAWSLDMLELNSETLEVIVLGVDNYEKLSQFPEVNCGQIIVCNATSFVKKVEVKARAGTQARCPHVQIQFDSLLHTYVADQLETMGLEFILG